MKRPVAVRGDLLIVTAALGAAGSPGLLVGACGCTGGCQAAHAGRPALHARITGGSRLPPRRTSARAVVSRSDSRANDASRSAVAGPPQSYAPPAMAVARRWLAALGHWQVAPAPAPAAELRALSTPALQRALLLTGPTREPIAPSFGSPPSAGRTVALRAYLDPSGWTVIATRQFGRDVLAVELIMVRTRAGPRVSSYEP